MQNLKSSWRECQRKGLVSLSAGLRPCFDFDSTRSRSLQTCSPGSRHNLLVTPARTQLSHIPLGRSRAETIAALSNQNGRSPRYQTPEQCPRLPGNGVPCRALIVQEQDPVHSTLPQKGPLSFSQRAGYGQQHERLREPPPPPPDDRCWSGVGRGLTVPRTQTTEKKKCHAKEQSDGLGGSVWATVSCAIPSRPSASLRWLSARELPFGCRMPSARHSKWPHESHSLASAAQEQSDKEIIMSLVWPRPGGGSWRFVVAAWRKIWFDIKDVTAVQSYRRRHRGAVCVCVCVCVCEGGPAAAIRKRLSRWRRMDQPNDPQPMGQLRSAAALWQCFGLCTYVCVCVFAIKCAWKLRGKSKGTTHCQRFRWALALESTIRLRTEDFHVFAPRSVHNFRLWQVWTHNTTFPCRSRVCGCHSSLNGDCQILEPTSNE